MEYRGGCVGGRKGLQCAAVLRGRASCNSCGAGTDISRKMNHSYTNERTHSGNGIQ